MTCPHCSEELKVPSEFMGEIIECPACERAVLAPAPSAPAAVPVPVVQPVADPAPVIAPPQQPTGGRRTLTTLLIVSAALNLVLMIVVIVVAVSRGSDRNKPSGMTPLEETVMDEAIARAREMSQKNTCINNMRRMDGAKEQWAMANNAANGEPVVMSEVNRYIKEETVPVCPSGGAYIYGTVGAAPRCSVHGALP
jgi:hypothetical protein